MDPLSQELDRLFDERPQRIVAVLVARRDDFDNGNDLTPAVSMADRDAVRFGGVEIGLGLTDESRARRSSRHCQAAVFFGRTADIRLDLQC